MTLPSRRGAFVAFAVAILLAVLVAPSAAVAATTTSLRIGTSVQGRPIEVACLGSGDQTVIVVGGLHTGPEAHSSDLVLELARLAWAGALDIPGDAQLCLIPTLNPDGAARGTRTNARGVDLNRNWPSANWTATALSVSRTRPRAAVRACVAWYRHPVVARPRGDRPHGEDHHKDQQGRHRERTAGQPPLCEEHQKPGEHAAALSRENTGLPPAPEPSTREWAIRCARAD
ncbi:MAG: M14 family zinc carboxypeptidase [Chloroflexi bacterium]|nr:M14 family zinc carboxypeptidase [Chloroflexota bacterium]MDA1146015.1 M14 family zinc carboxypeptidase [Chloroflexota bacterium]